MLNELIKKWYILNQSQRRGTVLLLFLLLLSILFKFFYVPDTEEDVLYFAYLNVQKTTASLQTKTIQDSLFPFNPNNITETEMKLMGLPEKLIKNIINYRKANGKFDTKESLKKLYSMNDSIYQKLEPYILISPEQKNTNSYQKHVTEYVTKSPTKYNFISIELNSADSTQLECINGIGKTLSVRIIKYRNRLGGFYSVEQLKEVYGIKDTLYNYITQKNKITIDTHLIKKITISTADFKTLIRHPYFNKDLIVKILQMQKNEKTLSPEKIKHLVDEATWYRLKHYLK